MDLTSRARDVSMERGKIAADVIADMVSVRRRTAGPRCVVLSVTIGRRRLVPYQTCQYNSAKPLPWIQRDYTGASDAMYNSFPCCISAPLSPQDLQQGGISQLWMVRSSTAENRRVFLLNLSGQRMASSDKLAALEGEKFARMIPDSLPCLPSVFARQTTAGNFNRTTRKHGGEIRLSTKHTHNFIHHCRKCYRQIKRFRKIVDKFQESLYTCFYI